MKGEPRGARQGLACAPRRVLRGPTRWGMRDRGFAPSSPVILVPIALFPVGSAMRENRRFVFFGEAETLLKNADNLFSDKVLRKNSGGDERAVSTFFDIFLSLPITNFLVGSKWKCKPSPLRIDHPRNHHHVPSCHSS